MTPDTTPRVLLDSASGLPLHPAAREALLAAVEDGWADPSRLYRSARRARQLLDGARTAIATELGCRADEIVLTPNGTVARYAAVRGVRAATARHGAHVVHSAIEHSSLLHAAAEGPATAVPVDALGTVDVDAFRASVQSDTVLTALIAASHEVGTRQPVSEVLSDVPLLVDAEATIGHAPVTEGWSLLTASAERWGGPVMGVLAVRTGVRWISPYPEEEGFGGAVPLPAVLAAAMALQAVRADEAAQAQRQRVLVDRIREVVAGLPDVEVVGDPVHRLPHLVAFSALYVEGEALVLALDRHGFEVSSGSSCTSSTLEPSHVLVAMGALTHGNLRVSLTRDTTEQDVERFLAVLPAVIADLRAEAGL